MSKTVLLRAFYNLWLKRHDYSLVLNKLLKQNMESVSLLTCVRCALKSHVSPQCGDGIEKRTGKQTGFHMAC